MCVGEGCLCFRLTPDVGGTHLCHENLLDVGRRGYHHRYHHHCQGQATGWGPGLTPSSS